MGYRPRGCFFHPGLQSRSIWQWDTKNKKRLSNWIHRISKTPPAPKVCTFGLLFGPPHLPSPPLWHLLPSAAAAGLCIGAGAWRSTTSFESGLDGYRCHILLGAMCWHEQHRRVSYCWVRFLLYISMPYRSQWFHCWVTLMQAPKKVGIRVCRNSPKDMDMTRWLI